jgi:hypothetical protein
MVGAPGSISIERETSRYISPRRSKGESAFPPSTTEESLRSSSAIDKAFLKEAGE